MASQIVIRSSLVVTTQPKPLISGTRTSQTTSNPTKTVKKSTSNVREVAGGTMANIFVVCCCCPCAPMGFLILAVYKVPASVVRRIWKKQRLKIRIKKSKKKRGVDQVKEVKEVGGEVHQQVVVGYVDEVSDIDWREFEKVKVSIDGSAEVVELDKMMWDQFRDAGFWRSPSQRLSGRLTNQ